MRKQKRVSPKERARRNAQVKEAQFQKWRKKLKQPDTGAARQLKRFLELVKE